MPNSPPGSCVILLLLLPISTVLLVPPLVVVLFLHILVHQPILVRAVSAFSQSGAHSRLAEAPKHSKVFLPLRFLLVLFLLLLLFGRQIALHPVELILAAGLQVQVV